MKPGNSFKRFLLVAIVAVVGALVAEAIVRSICEPEIDNNTAAYLALWQGMQSQSFATLKSAADQAERTATDRELKDLAGYMSRGAALRLDMGVYTFQEADSFSAYLKAVLTGLTRLDKSLDSIKLLVEGLLINPKELGRRVDARYQGVFAKTASAIQSSRYAFWLTLLVVGFVSWSLTAPSGQMTADSASVTADANLMTCPECGARNRTHEIRGGQKLVCGQCKTVLSEVA